MPFLTLNGITIPTAKGGKGQPQEIGERTMAFDGSAQLDRRGIKRQWKFKTTPLNEMRFAMYHDLLLGKGTYLQNESNAYASNGLAPAAGGAAGYYGLSADGAEVIDEDNITHVKFGSYARAIELATPWGFSQLNSEPSLSLWTASAGSRSLSSTHFFMGTTSQLWTSVATSDTLASANTFPTGGGFYGASLYVYCATAVDVTLRIRNVTSGFSYDTTRTLTANKWVRLRARTTTSQAVNSVFCMMVVATSSSAGVPIWISNVQLASYTGSGNAYPILWRAYPSTRVTEDARYPLPFTASSTYGFTVNLWTTKGRMTTGNGCFLSMNANATTGTPGSRIYITSGGTLTWELYNASGAAFTVSAAVSMTGWHMITAVYRSKPDTGEVNQALYFDGALIASASTVTNGLLAARMTHFFLGSNNATSEFSWSRMDEIQVLPYPIPAAWISAMYTYQNAGSVYSAFPNLLMSGNCLPEPSTLVQGMVDDWDVAPYYESATQRWRDSGRILNFTLTEV